MTSALEMFSLAGKNVVLTGASAGIGRRFARILVDAGASVALVARRQDILGQLAAELGDRAHPIAADLSQPSEADRVAADALDAFGHVDVVVNNAAYIAGGVRAEDETMEDIAKTLVVNLVAPIRIVQGILPSMRGRRSGTIVNVTSMVGSVGIGRFPQATYSASKGGLNAITREWAAQWSRHGIRANAIAPGFIETEMTSEVLQVPKVHEWVQRNALLGRPGQVDDFDGALLYLASDASRYVTGQILTVDGGWTAH